MDELRQLRALREDLRALKQQYPELTMPAAKRRLEDYLQISTEEEPPMPAKGDRTLGEDLITVTFKVQASVMPTVEQHLRTLQRTTRYQRIGRSDCLRDIFLRGIDSIENPPQQFPVVIDPGPELSRPTAPLVEPAAASAGGAIPPAPAYEARALTPEVPPEALMEHPLDDELEDMPLEPELDVTQEGAVPAVPREAPDWSQGSTWREAFDANPLTPTDVTQESVVPAAPAEVVTPPRGRKAARSKAAPPVEPEPEVAVYEAEVLTPEAFPESPAEATRAKAEGARPKAAAKKRTTRTTKGRK